MKLFEVSDINHMEYSDKNKSMKVMINGIVKYNNKETSILDIKCSYYVFCNKYLEFIKHKENIK